MFELFKASGTLLHAALSLPVLCGKRVTVESWEQFFQEFTDEADEPDEPASDENGDCEVLLV